MSSNVNRPASSASSVASNITTQNSSNSNKKQQGTQHKASIADTGSDGKLPDSISELG